MFEKDQIRRVHDRQVISPMPLNTRSSAGYLGISNTRPQSALDSWNRTLDFETPNLLQNQQFYLQQLNLDNLNSRANLDLLSNFN